MYHVQGENEFPGHTDIPENETNVMGTKVVYQDHEDLLHVYDSHNKINRISFEKKKDIVQLTLMVVVIFRILLKLDCSLGPDWVHRVRNVSR
jgi:hypothetical protein